MAGLRGRLIRSHSDASVILTTGRAYGVSVVPLSLREGLEPVACPTVIINQHGRGRAILLNFAITKYGAEAGYSRRMNRWMKALLESVDVRPQVSLIPVVAGSHLYRYQQGGNTYLGLLRKPPGVNVPGHDHSDREIERFKPVEFKINLPARYHLYDSRAGTYLGFDDHLKGTGGDVTALMIVAMPYRLRDIHFQCGDSASLQGQSVTLRAHLQTDTGDPAGLHVIHVELVDPNGREAV